MDKNSSVYRQVKLLVRLLPYVAKQECFALKGGTAINLFVRDLPRLSVDIDLHYLPFENRETALPAIRKALQEMEKDIGAAIPDIQIQTTDPRDTESLRMTLNADGDHLKVEISPVSRGTVWPPEVRETVRMVEQEFGYAEMQVVSFFDLYAGKICAALDRQDPRDLFDLKLLFENEGIDRKLFKTFLVYLISHNRPIAELLSPSLKDISASYNQFRTMVREQVTLEEILNVRDGLVKHIHQALTDDDRQFLLSVKGKTPDWSLLGLPGVENLPAVRWKLLNLNRMDNQKHSDALRRLEKVLQKQQPI